MTHDSRTCPDCVHLDRGAAYPYAVRGGGVYVPPGYAVELLRDVLGALEWLESVRTDPCRINAALARGTATAALKSVAEAMGGR